MLCLKGLYAGFGTPPPYLDAEPSSRGKMASQFLRQSNCNHFCFIGIFIRVQVQEIQN